MQPDGVEHFDRAAVARRFDVSRETMERLDILAVTLTRWSSAINLVARPSLSDLWHRHIADSAQLWRLAPDDATRWADLGAGGGFPGLVIAAMAAEHRPGLRMTLVESDSRKGAFLGEAARAMGLAVAVVPARVESLPSGGYDVVSARALAPLARLLPLARRLAVPGGCVLLPKGAEAESELAALPAIDREAATRHPSLTHPDAVILSWTLPDG